LHFVPENKKGALSRGYSSSPTTGPYKIAQGQRSRFKGTRAQALLLQELPEGECGGFGRNSYLMLTHHSNCRLLVQFIPFNSYNKYKRYFTRPGFDDKPKP